MNTRTILAGIAAYITWTTIGANTESVALPQFSIDGEKAKLYWTIAAALLPLLGPKGLKIKAFIDRLFDAIGVREGDEIDGDLLLDRVKKFKPLLDLLGLFDKSVEMGASPSEQRAIRAMIGRELDKYTRAIDEDPA